MNKKILIFDDDKALLDLFRIVLEPLGYEVDISETADDVIDKIGLYKPHVVIMDNWIPGTHGLEAIKAIRSYDNYRDIPVILCSANDDLVSLAERAGATAYLSKPFDLVELEMVVESMFKLVNPI